MKFLRMFGIMAISGLLLAGCASVAHVEKDDTADFSTYKTYSWVSTQASQTAKPGARQSDLTDRNIRNAINGELAKAGWKEVKGRPDVLLSYDILVERNIKEQNNPVYSNPTTRYYFNPYTRRWNSLYFPSQFLGYDNQTTSVREGTLTVSMVDTRTDKTVWQGWTTDEVNGRTLSGKEIQSSVKSIFRKFDVVKN